MAARSQALLDDSSRRVSSAYAGNEKPHWVLWWPLVLGLAVTPFAIRYAEVLPLLGPEGMTRLREIFPFTMLLHDPQLGLSYATADALSRAFLYLQFPLYGYVGAFMLRRSGLVPAAATILIVHALGVLTVLLLTTV